MDRDPGYFGITLKFEQYEKIDLFYIRITRASCYDDKGNYTYQEVNTLDVSLNKVYSVRLDKDTTVTIIPQLSQSLQEMRIIWNIRGCIRQPIIIFTDMASSTRLDWKRI